jgi:hypothetical protein
MIDFIDEIIAQFITDVVVPNDPTKDIILEKPNRTTAIYETRPTPTEIVNRAQKRNFQVVSRADNYDDAQTDIWACYNALTNSNGEGVVELNGNPYMIMTYQTPYKMKTDSEGRVYFFFNFTASVQK